MDSSQGLSEMQSIARYPWKGIAKTDRAPADAQDVCVIIMNR